MPTRSSLAVAALLVLAAKPAAADAILTFDIIGLANHQTINQAYGDRVSAASDAVGSYGTTDGLYAPNVLVDYGATGEDPALWTTGYGDLTNIYFNDADRDTTFTTRFTADTGYLVSLLSFDMASFLSGGQTIQGARVLDELTSAVLWSVGPTFVTGATHLGLAPNATGQSLRLEVDLTGLGAVSDDIGIDNIRFAQSAVPSSNVPEPATLSMLAFGIVAAWRKTRRARRDVGA